MNLDKLIKLAKKLALKSTHPRHKMSCIVFKRNTLLSFGINAIKTHPKSKDPHHMIHAELNAILDIDERDLDGASVLVYRERRCGGCGMAKPCQSCEAMLKAVGVKEVYYTTEKEVKFFKF